MILLAFLQWWYGPGWGDAANQLRHRLRQTAQDFSIPILLQTLFDPWRRIITTGDGPANQKLRALTDNAVSRLVGFAVRSLAILAAVLVQLLYIIVGGLILIGWPLAPVLAPVFVIWGVL